MKYAVLASGSGSNFETLVGSAKVQSLGAHCAGLLCDKADAYALKRAERLGVAGFFKSSKKNEYEAYFLSTLEKLNVEVVLLAGFMRVLSKDFISRCPAPMLNIHPSLLPAYKGLHTHQRVLQTGELMHGCSIHAVVPELDSGQILAQSCFRVPSRSSASTLQSQVHELEHVLYPEVLSWLAGGRLTHSGLGWSLDNQLIRMPVVFFKP